MNEEPFYYVEPEYTCLPCVIDKNTKSEDCQRFSDSDVIFEIFGLKLRFDDILIMALLFFLYSEGVDDQWLFISLILLLIT